MFWPHLCYIQQLTLSLCFCIPATSSGFFIYAVMSLAGTYCVPAIVLCTLYIPPHVILNTLVRYILLLLLIKKPGFRKMKQPGPDTLASEYIPLHLAASPISAQFFCLLTRSESQPSFYMLDPHLSPTHWNLWSKSPPFISSVSFSTGFSFI